MNNKLNLLPHYFKYIGALTCTLTPVAFFILWSIIQIKPDPGFSKFIAYSGFIIGLLFIALAREKIEDEMMVSIRTQSMVFAFLFSCIYFAFIKPLTTFFMEGTIPDVKSNEVILTMLIAYIMTFHFQKWRMK